MERMVEILLRNMHRIHDYWAIFLSHVVEVSVPKSHKVWPGFLVSVTGSQ